MDLGIPFPSLPPEGQQYPTDSVMRNKIKNPAKRKALLKAGVVAKVDGRWLFFPTRWAEYIGSNPDQVA
ncbi:MAG: hypothetical protein AAGM16_03250 [Pseudomonadota bacterium]